MVKLPASQSKTTHTDKHPHTKVHMGTLWHVQECTHIKTRGPFFFVGVNSCQFFDLWKTQVRGISNFLVAGIEFAMVEVTGKFRSNICWQQKTDFHTPHSLSKIELYLTTRPNTLKSFISKAIQGGSRLRQHCLLKLRRDSPW